MSPDTLFSYVSIEDRIPASHPLRRICKLADQALDRLNPTFSELYATEGRPLVRPEPICRSWIQVPYGEEEITLLEEEVLPLLAQLLQLVEAIDHELELQQQAEVALEPAEVS